jgi:hypothetical protein
MKPHIRMGVVGGWWLWVCGDFPYQGAGMTPVAAYRAWHGAVTTWRVA